MNKAVIILSGYNGRAVLAFLRTLETTGVKYALIAKSEGDEIFLSAYKDKVLAIRSKPELNMGDLMGCIKKVQQLLPADRYVIAPSTEALNRFLLEKRAVFESAGCEVPLVEKKLYERISDKEAFSAVCKENNLLLPAEADKSADLDLPMVAKPKKYYSTTGEVFSPVLIRSQQELEAFSKEHHEADFFFQQFVGGQSQYLLYYFYKDGEVAKLSQINYVQQAGGKSIVAAEISNFSNDNESQKYERLFNSLNFHGLVMVEVKTYKGKNYMIEANPRFWGPSQLFVDANFNLFDAFLYDCGLAKTKPIFKTPKNSKYFWFGGTLETLSQGKSLAYHSCSPNQFAEDFSDWLSADLYNRADSRQIFIKQTGLE